MHGVGNLTLLTQAHSNNGGVIYIVYTGAYNEKEGPTTGTPLV